MLRTLCEISTSSRMQHQLGHCPVVPIRQFLREMRGGSQARLVRAADSQVYVAKFSNNPQGRRTLINERIASYLIEKLGIASPSTVLLSLSDEIIRQEDACFRVGTGRVPIVAGIHLGITCPANPFTTRILDVAPPTSLWACREPVRFRLDVRLRYLGFPNRSATSHFCSTKEACISSAASLYDRSWIQLFRVSVGFLRWPCIFSGSNNPRAEHGEPMSEGSCPNLCIAGAGHHGSHRIDSRQLVRRRSDAISAPT